MVDRYTKVVLTIIAAVMVYNVVKDGTGTAQADPADCGNALDPCYVSLSGETIKVEVEGSVHTYQ